MIEPEDVARAENLLRQWRDLQSMWNGLAKDYQPEFRLNVLKRRGSEARNQVKDLGQALGEGAANRLRTTMAIAARAYFHGQLTHLAGQLKGIGVNPPEIELEVYGDPPAKGEEVA